MMKPFAGINVAAVTPHGKRGDEPDIAATLELIFCARRACRASPCWDRPESS